MSWVRRLYERPWFSERTRDRLQAFIVFGLVPLMVAMMAALLLQVSAWTGAAKQREERRTERLNNAVQEVIDEVRDPQSEGGDSREETFDRIRQLCEVHEGCEP